MAADSRKCVGGIAGKVESCPLPPRKSTTAVNFFVAAWLSYDEKISSPWSMRNKNAGLRYCDIAGGGYFSD